MISLAKLVLISLALIASDVSCLKIHNKIRGAGGEGIPPFKTFHSTQYVDHFNQKDNRRFEMRYILNDDYWDPKQGPIFFYTGNEGDVVNFWNNTGFMFDIAPQFKAMVVFAEHRYYGESLPFGNSSFDQDKIQYLSVEQALADYAVFLTQFTKGYNLTRSGNPVIAFGGSYGGILAAYMRFKYPSLIQGSIAASAPIFLTSGLKPTNLFFGDVTKDFDMQPGCVANVRSAFAAMQDAFNKRDYNLLNNKFKLCSPISTPHGFRHLQLWLRNAFTIMAMVDYPYPASFLANLPAWPVKASCALLNKEISEGVDVLTAIKDLAGILYNDTSSCFDINAQFIECADPTSCGLGNDAKAWDYQACTELNTVQASNGVTDMFPVFAYDEKARQDYCNKTWHVHIKKRWTEIQFWGKNIETATNIVFSNGLLDPWHRGGPLTNVSSSAVAVLIKEGAHHLDLRASNIMDPVSVKIARFQEMDNIAIWIAEARKLKD